MAERSFSDYLQRVNIQEVLKEAGYVLNRKDGIRYPSYIRLDASGHKVSGDKFLITRNGQCCFQPPEDKRYNVISFITEHPEKFDQYRPDMNPYYLVHCVCSKILNEPVPDRNAAIFDFRKERDPFSLSTYNIRRWDKDDYKPFYPYFVSRGINLSTQSAFRQDFMLAERQSADGKSYASLSFPLRIPSAGPVGDVVGLEQRGRRRSDGTSYKGMAAGSNSSEGLWIASPNRRSTLEQTRNVYWFESAYDAMAYYQLHRSKDYDARYGVYVSTGGNPSVGQMRGVLEAAPDARHHLCFDEDAAGWQFVENFRTVAGLNRPQAAVPKPEYGDTLARPDLIPYLESLKARETLTDKVRNIFTSRGRKEEFAYVLSGDMNLLPDDFKDMDRSELREALVDYNDLYLGCKAYKATVAEREDGQLLGDFRLLPAPLLDIYNEYESHHARSVDASLNENTDAMDVELREKDSSDRNLQRINDVVAAWTTGAAQYRPAYDVIREVPSDGSKDWNEQLLKSLRQSEAVSVSQSEGEKKNMTQENDESRQTRLSR